MTRFAYPGAAPGISANGTEDALVWVVEARGSDAGVLHAYDAFDLTHEPYNSAKTNRRDAFSDNKFITPVIANGRVFVGTLTGVAVFGLLKAAGSTALIRILQRKLMYIPRDHVGGYRLWR